MSSLSLSLLHRLFRPLPAATFPKPRLTIFPLSDWHIDNHGKRWEPIFKKLPPSDVLILAGDIAHVKTCHPVFRSLKSKYSNVLFVPGNLEWFTSGHNENHIRDLCADTGVIYLNKRKLVIRGVSFLGASLWSAVDERALLRNHGTHIEFLERFVEDLRWLKAELLKTSGTPTVVVTHYVPTKRLIPDLYNPYFASNLGSNILDNLNLHDVYFWFCGRVHYADVLLYNNHTQLILNPIGLPGQETHWSSTVYRV